MPTPTAAGRCHEDAGRAGERRRRLRLMPPFAGVDEPLDAGREDAGREGAGREGAGGDGRPDVFPLPSPQGLCGKETG